MLINVYNASTLSFWSLIAEINYELPAAQVWLAVLIAGAKASSWA